MILKKYINLAAVFDGPLINVEEKLFTAFPDVYTKLCKN